jgi:hypothetical protein
MSHQQYDMSKLLFSLTCIPWPRKFRTKTSKAQSKALLLQWSNWDAQLQQKDTAAAGWVAQFAGWRIVWNSAARNAGQKSPKQDTKKSGRFHLRIRLSRTYEMQ